MVDMLLDAASYSLSFSASSQRLVFALWTATLTSSCVCFPALAASHFLLVANNQLFFQTWASCSCLLSSLAFLFFLFLFLTACNCFSDTLTLLQAGVWRHIYTYMATGCPVIYLYRFLKNWFCFFTRYHIVQYFWMNIIFEMIQSLKYNISKYYKNIKHIQNIEHIQHIANIPNIWGIFRFF